MGTYNVHAVHVFGSLHLRSSSKNYAQNWINSSIPRYPGWAARLDWRSPLPESDSTHNWDSQRTILAATANRFNFQNVIIGALICDGYNAATWCSSQSVLTLQTIFIYLFFSFVFLTVSSVQKFRVAFAWENMLIQTYRRVNNNY